ncbi:hypothetical protein [Streptomyces sp. ALI-76-A]|nr:hypothetical protein [Streptomyces sp. ALI-76-A]MDL5203402.1 hypothetical protein [Streptomyces sp. ALI-76-A]
MYVYEPAPATRDHGPTGVFRDRMKLAVRFGLEPDLTSVDRRGR